MDGCDWRFLDRNGEKLSKIQRIRPAHSPAARSHPEAMPIRVEVIECVDAVEKLDLR